MPLLTRFSPQHIARLERVPMKTKPEYIPILPPANAVSNSFPEDEIPCHTQGPWDVWPPLYEHTFAEIRGDAAGENVPVANVYSKRSARVASANANLIMDAPAMAICLELIQKRKAKIEGFIFCFQELRLIIGNDRPYTRILNAIGWRRATEALEDNDET